MLGSMSDATQRSSYLLSCISTTAELLAQGLSTDRIRKLAGKGTLLSLGRGVYVRAGVARRYRSMDGGELLLQAAAALALTRRDAVVSHETAAQLQHIALLRQPTPQVILTVPHGESLHGRAGVRLHAAEVPAEHVSLKLGLPVTTPARTVVDLARTLDFRSGVVAADSALHFKLATKAELKAVIAACPRWPGLQRAVKVVAFADSLAESPLESVARVVFSDLGLPTPELQVWVGGMTEPIARVDFLWRDFRTIAEVDGAIKYQDPLRAKAQLRRDSELRAEGFEVVHFDWHEITENPQRVAAQIRLAFARGQRTAAARAAIRARKAAASRAQRPPR
jgi:hypothetical protein